MIFSLTGIAWSMHSEIALSEYMIKPLPRDLEVELALSSLPAHLRGNATVYVLKPDKGFEVVKKGTNGFHAFVARTDVGAFRGKWPMTEYPDDILVPISFDSAGAKEQMRVFFDAAKMQAEGTAPGRLQETMKDRFNAGFYKAPERDGISYMLSPILRAYTNPDEGDAIMTFNYPHYMFYSPDVTNADIGGQLLSPHIFVITPGPHGYMIKGVGLTEKAVINKEYEDMLARLCEFKEAFCIPKQN
jgi:hypothetical protein